MQSTDIRQNRPSIYSTARKGLKRIETRLQNRFHRYSKTLDQMLLKWPDDETRSQLAQIHFDSVTREIELDFIIVGQGMSDAMNSVVPPVESVDLDAKEKS